MTAVVEPRTALLGERARQSLPAKVADPAALRNVAVLVVAAPKKAF